MLHSKPVRHGAGRTVHRYSAVLQLQPAQCGAQTDLRRYDAVLQLEQGCGQHPVQVFFWGGRGVFTHSIGASGVQLGAGGAKAVSIWY